MAAFYSFEDVWKHFDDIGRKKFLFHDVVAAINSLSDSTLDPDVCRAELLAFNFSENSSGGHWGLYYGPQFTFVKKDTGEEVYIPDIKDITQEILQYWEERGRAVRNPILKMRYTGLVLVFKKKLFNIEPDYQSIKLAYVNALHDVIEGDYCQYATMALDYAERALGLSIGFKNVELQNKSVEVYYNAHKHYSVDDMHPGIWGRIMQSLLKHRAYFARYEDVLVNEQIERYQRLKNLSLTEGSKTDRYVHVLSDQVDLLADYYHLIGENTKIKQFLDSTLDAIKLSINARGGLWGQGMLQKMQERYRKYGFDTEANMLFVDLADLGEQTLNEMHPVQVSVPIDKEFIDAFLSDALKGTHKEVLQYFLLYYLPSLEKEKDMLKEKTEKYPLLDAVSTVTIDSSGKAISKVGVGPDAERQKLFYSMYENMRYLAPFMHLHITKMKEQGYLTAETILGFLESSPLIPEEHKEIVRKGIVAYMEDDYIVCCHLLIPQMEAAIRRLFALNGANIMRSKKDPVEGSQYQSLDTLLASPDAITFMGEDMAIYLRNLLTDQYGWNLRNQLSHGLIGTESFDYGMADRVIHAFMLLGGFEKKELSSSEQYA